MRKLRRMVAKKKMEWAGMHGICSRHGNRGCGSKKTLHTPNGGQKSYFAAHWREFV